MEYKVIKTENSIKWKKVLIDSFSGNYLYIQKNEESNLQFVTPRLYITLPEGENTEIEIQYPGCLPDTIFNYISFLLPQNIPNCLEYDEDDHSFCKKCSYGYKGIGGECNSLTSYCQKISVGCIECERDSCTKCMKGYDLDVTNNKCVNSCTKPDDINRGINGKCQSKILWDKNCDSFELVGICNKCKDGYYLQGYLELLLCVKCPLGCKRCDSEDICTECEDGYIENNNKCASSDNHNIIQISNNFIGAILRIERFRFVNNKIRFDIYVLVDKAEHLVHNV